jgi:putative transposase
MITLHGSLSAQALNRLQGGALILKGYDNSEIADIVGVTERTVPHWRRTLQDHNDDVHALIRKKGSGRLHTLTDAQKLQVKEIVLAGAKASGFPDERWTSTRAAQVIRQTFKIDFSRSATRRLLHSLGLSPQMPVVKSHKHSDEEVLRWTNREWKRIKKRETPRHSLDFLGRERILSFSDSWNDVGRGRQAGGVAGDFYSSNTDGTWIDYVVSGFTAMAFSFHNFSGSDDYGGHDFFLNGAPFS